jgi:hypothetical protein
MDMLRASTVKSIPIDSKVNVKRGSDINDYEEDILYGPGDDMPEEDDKYGVVEQFTGSDIMFMPMPPHNIQRIPDRKDLKMRVQLFHKDIGVEHKMMKEYFIERVRVDKEIEEDTPDPVNIFQKDSELFIALKLNSECELLQCTYLGVWPGLLDALPWDKIELLDFFMGPLIFSTPLREKALSEATNTGRIAEYIGWEDEAYEEEGFEQALDDNAKLGSNEGRPDDSFHASDFNGRR